MIIFSVGISGCGKSAYGEKLKNKRGTMDKGHAETMGKKR